MLNMSRNTVKKYLQVYQKSGLSLEVILSMDDSSLCSLFQEKDKPSEEPPARYKELQTLLASNYSRNTAPVILTVTPGVVFVIISKLTWHYLTRLPTWNTRRETRCSLITPGTSSR